MVVHGADGKRGSVTKLAEELNTTPLELVQQVVEKHNGSLRKASVELHCAVNTVRYWMIKSGYAAKAQGFTWVKAE